MNKRKLLLVALSLCMVAILAMGGTLAYLTDTDNDVNTFTVGKVKIVQNEKDRNGKDFEDAKLFPIVDDVVDAQGFHQGKNYLDKMVSVTVDANSEDVYVRTYMAIPAALDNGPTTFDANANILHWNGASAKYDKAIAEHGKVNVDENYWYWGTDLSNDWPGNGGAWNGYQTTVNGVLYNVYVATHSDVLQAGDTTAPSLLGVYLDKMVNVDEEGYFLMEEGGARGTAINFDLSKEFNILIKTEAVQATGFDNAIYALDSAFGYVGEHDPFGGKIGNVFPATVAATEAAKAAK